MSEEEIKDIHKRHKRAELKAENIRKSDFEVNREEDEDEDFAGPTLDLFHQVAPEEADMQERNDGRQRKENDILRRVEDVPEEASESGIKLPISHEVILKGHHK